MRIDELIKALTELGFKRCPAADCFEHACGMMIDNEEIAKAAQSNTANELLEKTKADLAHYLKLKAVW